jgi:hypothetical protein
MHLIVHMCVNKMNIQQMTSANMIGVSRQDIDYYVQVVLLSNIVPYKQMTRVKVPMMSVTFMFPTLMTGAIRVKNYYLRHITNSNQPTICTSFYNIQATQADENLIGKVLTFE